MSASPRDEIAAAVVWDAWSFPVDTIILAGIESAGVVTLDGFEDERKFEVAEGKGKTGATVSYQGHGVAKGKIVWRSCCVEHDQSCEQAVALLRAALAEEPPVAVEAIHPELWQQGITKIQLVKVGKWSRSEGGIRTREIEVQEFLPSKAKGGSGGVAKSTTTQAGAPAVPPPAPAEPTPEDPAVKAAREEKEEAEAAWDSP